MTRWLLRGVFLLVTLVLGAALAGWLVFRASLPALDGAVAAAGAPAPVRIERDAAGIVTVQGATLRDAAFGLGYAHGQDRFFQMDLSRRLAAGELAALFGAAAFAQDQLARPFAFRAVARRADAAASPQERAWLAAYVAGVNAGLGSLRARPWEYWVLRARPQPWREEDSLLVLHAMWWQLQFDDIPRERLRDEILTDASATRHMRQQFERHAISLPFTWLNQQNPIPRLNPPCFSSHSRTSASRSSAGVPRRRKRC